MLVDVVVPAHNEAPYIGAVLEAILGARGVGQVLVVSDASSDATAARAQAAGASVVAIAAGDKGTAMAAGLEAVTTDAVLFIDADLKGLRPQHVTALATLPPHNGQLVGLRGSTPLGIRVPRCFGLLPSISGERRVPVSLARTVGLAGAGWEAETRLNVAVAELGLPWRHIVLKGVSNRSKTFGDPLAFAGEMLDVATVAATDLPALARYAFRPRRRPHQT